MSYNSIASVGPYYDDFDPAKNYHRILFQPGYSVQARELTQSQTILQNQITNFADNIFAPNSPVSGGQITTNLSCNYVRLLSSYNNVSTDVNNFFSNNTGILVRNSSNTVVAQVVAVAPASGSDSPTLVLSYKTGTQFSAGDVIYGSGSNYSTQAQVVSTPFGSVQATGQSSVASVSQGVFYVLGTFVQVNPQTIILDKYDNTPNARIGLAITEAAVNYTSDSSLLDTALGASNYQAPGADRYQINLTLASLPLSFGDDTSFVELVRIESGIITKRIDSSVYSTIDDYFAKRDYETNGDYVVHDFALTPKANTSNNSVYTMSIGPGVAYVHGYRTENLGTLDLTTNRARTTASSTSNPVYLDYGSYFYVNTLRGANADFFNTTTTQPIEIHCVSVANVNVATATAYSATTVATGYMRNIQYDHVAGSDTLANSYIYRAYVHDLQLNNPTGTAVSATANTMVLPTTFSSVTDAYAGVTITITKGTNVGDFRTIASYNGSTKTVTVTPNWTQTPDATSVFALNFDIKDAETIIATQTPTYSLAASPVIYGSAAIDPTSKSGGVPTGQTILQNPSVPELVFPVGYPYANNITNQSYTSQVLITGVSASNSFPVSIASYSSGAFKYIGTASSTLSTDLIKQNFVMIVTAVSSNPTYKVGDLIPASAITTATLGSGLVQSITFTSSTIYGLTIDVLAKVQANYSLDSFNGIVKYKNLITGNTTQVGSTFTASPTGPDNQATNAPTYTFVDLTKGQVYIQKAGLVSAGQKNLLYVPDIKRVVKIIDTGASGTIPTNAMLTGASYDVTNNFILDNGQRDNFYDFASVTLRPGASQPNGNLLVIFDYYDSQKTGSSGDGYFNLLSYTTSSKPESYQQIPQYVSKHGTIYNLRDCIDFRPQRLYGQTKFVYGYKNAGNVWIPSDLSTFNCTYSYYLGRQDKLVLSKDKSFLIVEGTPSLNPVLPSEPDGSLVIATMTHNPYTGYLPTEAPTGYLPDLSTSKVQHKRYTMEDIAGLESRINHIEYYTALNLLEQSATSLQTPDAYGLNRFKNGILVDNFQNYATADTFSADYSATVNARTQTMTATQKIGNYPLKSLVTSYNMSLLANTVNNSSLGYAINTDGYVNYFTLPYTSNAAIIQPFASRTVNVNPFSFAVKEGTVYLSPNVDNWVDTNYSPSLLITDPNLQVFQASNTLNVLTAGDWQTIPGTTTSSTVNTIGHNINPSPFGVVGYSTTTTYASQQQTNVVGNYSSLGNTYGLNNGYITNISVLPYIRQQTVSVRAKGMLQKTTVTPTFDNTDVTNYFRKANIIELSGVSGQFMEDDVIGYYSSGTFTPTGRVIGVYNYIDNNGNWTNYTRLYVAADGYTNTYTINNIVQNAYFDSNYNYVNSSASGTFVSETNYGGQINNNLPAQSNFYKLSPVANSTSIIGQTLYITAGTGAGQSGTISNFFTANDTALLSTSITCSNGDIYSIGTISTDEAGAVYGIFCIPPNVFHTGQRVFHFDNSVNQNLGSATTYSDGTFYAQGLSVQAQQVDFGASPSGAKGTFTQTNVIKNVRLSSVVSPWDPVAQTFMVDKNSYPNGLFLNSVQFYFASKPTADSTPITLSIVGTQNGYPDGKTLDGSVVVLTPDQITTTTAPYSSNNQTASVFTFTTPVYIQPEVLYAFLLKSTSSQYTMWSAASGDTALLSTTNGVGTKIGSAPYVGALFLSQNSQTWTADQNQDLMFVANQCIFNTSVSPSIPFVVPKKMPQRTMIEQSILQVTNPNNYAPQLSSISNTDQVIDALNVSTTDFIPTTTGINYSYNATLASSGAAAGITGVNPGKYGTTMYDNLYLTDSRGERILQANSNTSFTMYAQLTSSDPNVSPIVSDAGLSVYTITWNINNCELSNSLITIANTGSGYTQATTTATVSAPITGGNTATAVANVSGGQVVGVYITSGGSNYLTTPTITIADSGGGINANVIVSGETSARGGPATAKYVTKKVVLDAGYDSGDLNVYMTAYRPVNTDINVYYKILNRNDTMKFEDASWQLMTKVNNSGIAYSQTRTDTYEYVFAPGNYVSSNTATAAAGVDQGYVQYTSLTGQVYTSFSQFAIKVVMTSSDHTFTPFLSDLRVLALPASVNTTV
jgi:hypothetical protein